MGLFQSFELEDYAEKKFLCFGDNRCCHSLLWHGLSLWYDVKITIVGQKLFISSIDSCMKLRKPLANEFFFMNKWTCFSANERRI